MKEREKEIFLIKNATTVSENCVAYSPAHFQEWEKILRPSKNVEDEN